MEREARRPRPLQAWARDENREGRGDKMAADLGAEISCNLLSATALDENWQLGTPQALQFTKLDQVLPQRSLPASVGFFCVKPPYAGPATNP